MIISLNCIRRASFRKSSFGFARKLYSFPSEPMMEIFLGFCSELITTTSSSNSIEQAISTRKKFFRSSITLEGRHVVSKRLMRVMLRGVVREGDIELRL